MAVYLSPAGLASAAVPNSLNVLATYKEKLCRCICSTSTDQPAATATYRYETPVLQGSTVFIPIVATITIVTPNSCRCTAETQVITERFTVAFFGQTALPTAVTITQEGLTQGLYKIVCGKSNCYAIHEGLTITITPGATPATVAAVSEASVKKSKE